MLRHINILLIMISAVAAQTNPVKETMNMAGATFYGVVSILAGLFLVFLGFRLVKPIVFLAGFHVGSLVTFIIIENIDVARGRAGMEFIPLAVGIVTGFIAIKLFKLGIVSLAALGGFAFGTFLLSWKSKGLIEGKVERPIFLLAMSIIPAILVLFFEKPVIIVATSILGSVLTGIGIDLFAQLGFASAIRTFISNKGEAEISGKLYYLLASMIVLALVGVLVQFGVTGRHKKSFVEKKQTISMIHRSKV